MLINGYWEPGKRVAFPDAVNDVLLARFAAPPAKGRARDSFVPQVTWTQKVLRDYVLSELRPDVIINWFTEPDHLQHAIGAGSPDARAAIRNDDREVGLLLDRLRELNLADKTNILVVSDHGFGHSTFGVNVTKELIQAGLKESANSDDVVIASSGQTMALHVRNHDHERIGNIVRFLQRQPWAGVLFTTGSQSGDSTPIEGSEPGTFSLQLVHLANSERGPDIVLTFPWTSAKGPFGLSRKPTTPTRPLRGPCS